MLCNLGMSTGMMVKKLEQEAEQISYEIERAQKNFTAAKETVSACRATLESSKKQAETVPCKEEE